MVRKPQPGTRSRTTTTQWRHLRTKTIKAAHDEGLTCCPLCGVTLVWEPPRRPESAEVDHIIPHALGGKDHPDNVRVICSQCNSKLGASVRRSKPEPTQYRKGKDQTSREW